MGSESIRKYPAETTWSQLARQRATSNGACWRASTLQQVLFTHSPVQSDFCHSPRRHPVRSQRWLPDIYLFFPRFYLQFTHLKVFYCYFRSSFFKYEIICSFLGVFRGILIVFKESEISAGAPVCAAFCSMCFVRLVVASRNLFIRFYLQLWINSFKGIL